MQRDVGALEDGRRQTEREREKEGQTQEEKLGASF